MPAVSPGCRRRRDGAFNRIAELGPDMGQRHAMALLPRGLGRFVGVQQDLVMIHGSPRGQCRAWPQHCLYLRPLPHRQGSLRPTLGVLRRMDITGGLAARCRRAGSK